MIDRDNYLKNIPQELRKYKQWLWFKIYYNKDKNGKIKVVKIPISPITYKSTEWNKAENQVDFETALNGLENSDCDGLSFVLTEDDPYICIDIDKLFCIESEKIANIIQDFNLTYKEMSVSKKDCIFLQKEIYRRISITKMNILKCISLINVL